jgi:hypothetical protein
MPAAALTRMVSAFWSQAHARDRFLDRGHVASRRGRSGAVVFMAVSGL